MSFARDTATRAYDDQRAAEYDEWYEGTGLFATRDRPGWDDEVAQLLTLVRGLPPARTLDVAPDERAAFLAEARRVARELVVIDSAPRPGVATEGWQERRLNDGSAHRVFKRYLSASALAAELGGDPLLDGAWFSSANWND